MAPMARPDRPTDEPVHDVLAAEEFGVPAPDPSLHHGPITLPEDPSGIVEPHDVLAAEEFAMPAPAPGQSGSTRPRQPSRQTSVIAAVASLAVLWVARRVLGR
jgi:hypothetical protein